MPITKNKTVGHSNGVGRGLSQFGNKIKLGKEGLLPNVTNAKGRLSQEGTVSPQFFGITLERLAYYGKILSIFAHLKERTPQKQINFLFPQHNPSSLFPRNIN